MAKKNEKLTLTLICPQCGKSETVETDAAIVLYGKPGSKRTVDMLVHHLSYADMFDWLMDGMRSIFQDVTSEEDDKTGEGGKNG